MKTRANTWPRDANRREFVVGCVAAVVGSMLPAKIFCQSRHRSWTLADGDYARALIRQILFIPDELPELKSRIYGQFQPMAGVVAERVSFATLSGMRIPAIVYRPASIHGKVPGMVVVNGHSGDKASWYAFYAGVLYALAGYVVVTYDPLGEFERNEERRSDTRLHDTVLPEPEMKLRVAGQMIGDILQAVSYVRQRRDVDADRIAVMAYSMGSFQSAIAGALDRRFRALILSGGGNLDGPGGYWDVSKPMCQGGAYQALSFLGDRGAVLYALNAQRGPTLVMNGDVDGLIVKPHTDEAFFESLRDRTAAITGSRNNLPETVWFKGAGHRPNFVTRPAALWLEREVGLPLWTKASIEAMPESHVSEWAKTTGAHVGASFANELSEGGIEALRTDVPNIPREQLRAIPEKEWQTVRGAYTYESWVRKVSGSGKGAQVLDRAGTIPGAVC
jgi:dienelactone hydrolase